MYNQAFIIIWPKYYDFINNLINELNNYEFKIIEKQEKEVNNIFIKNILQQIHFNKKWWEKNLDPQFNLRINKNNKKQILQYLIIEKNNIHLEIKSLKKKIREKYKITKSNFHICDPDCKNHIGLNCDCICDKILFEKEFKKHSDFFKNPNTYHFLNNASIQLNYNFFRFFKNFYQAILKSKVKIEKFCIDNGGVLALYGIRDTHDLDFLTSYTDNIKVSIPNVGCENKNHRLEYKKLGLTIQDIINNPKNHFYFGEIKFISLELLKKFKYNRTHTIGTGHKKIREKDINDYKLINNII
jgi:hypothetical protein